MLCAVRNTVKALGIASLCWVGQSVNGRAQLLETEPKAYVLDAICATPDPMKAPLKPGIRPASNIKMAKMLADLRDAAEPSSMSFLTDRMVQKMESDLAAATTTKDKSRILFHLGVKQMQAGKPDEGLNTFMALDKLVAENNLKLDQNTKYELRMRKAVAFLRLGEQENCLLRHNAESCLFPLRPMAFHLLPRGSRGAIELFNEALAENPNDLSARWLLNLAHMTLGEYPDKVPPQFVIPPKTFDSEYDMPRFPDVAGSLGIDVDDLAGGVIVDDFDNDGFLDIVTSAWGLEGQLRYFHNDGNGQFTQRTSEAGLVGLTSGLNIIQTDYNNDGWIDIMVLRGGWLSKAGRLPCSLLRNNKDGTFTDVTEEAGLLRFHPTQTASWFDYDGDGWLDVFIGNETTDQKDPDYSELFHNNRDGTFTECGKLCGVRVAEFVKGVACADYDHDGRPDLYLSIRNGPNMLFHNDGPAEPGTGGTNSGAWKFSEVAVKAGVTEPKYSFPTWFFDFDNDGWDDLFCSGYATRDVGDIAADYLGLPTIASKAKMYRNNHDGTFTDVSVATHMDRVCHTMGSNFGDLDNDGFLDFYLGTGDPDFTTLIPNRMFHNGEGKVFHDVTTATGTGHIQKGHGVAFADLDNNGSQDIYAVMGGAFSGDTARNALFLNPINTNHWVKLKLVGVKANRAAIGARLKVTVLTPSGTRDIYKTVNSGGSFGANPLRQELGLGQASAIKNLEIQWPGSGTVQMVAGLELDNAYEITEGSEKGTQLHLKKIEFKNEAHPAQSVKAQPLRSN